MADIGCSKPPYQQVTYTSSDHPNDRPKDDPKLRF